MPIIAKESGGNFVLPDQGTHVARCFAVIALGTQNSPQFPASFKIMIEWELPESTVLIENKPTPMIIQKEFTLSLSQKSNLRRDLESWRGRAFTPEELSGFEVSKIVGQPCLLSIAHKTTKTSGKTYAAVQSVAAVMKGAKVTSQFHESVIYEVEQGKNAAYQKMPEWIQKKIAACEEWLSPPIDQEQPDSQSSDVEADSSVPF